MKKNIGKKNAIILLLSLALTAALAGCGSSDSSNRENSTTAAAAPTAGTIQVSSPENSEADTRETPAGAEALEVRFGDAGREAFVMNLEDNSTAAAIAGYVGTAEWRLPIYHYDDFENWEVMQYYDIPSRYDIPSDAVTVTSEKAGEVYYSEPNRIILFYHDAEVTGEYTKIGTIEATEDFQSAVEDNPVLEGWGNKIVHINSMD